MVRVYRHKLSTGLVFGAGQPAIIKHQILSRSLAEVLDTCQVNDRDRKMLKRMKRFSEGLNHFVPRGSGVSLLPCAPLCLRARISFLHLLIFCVFGPYCGFAAQFRHPNTSSEFPFPVALKRR